MAGTENGALIEMRGEKSNKGLVSSMKREKCRRQNKGRPERLGARSASSRGQSGEYGSPKK